MASYGFLDQPAPPVMTSVVPSVSAAGKKIFSIIPTPPGRHPNHKDGKTIHLIHLDYLFKALGLLPLHYEPDEISKIKKAIGIVLQIVGLALLFGTWVSTCLQLGQAAAHLNSYKTDELRTLQVLIDLVPVAINLRAAIVLALFMWKRHRWYPLMNRFSSLIRHVYAPSDLPEMIFRWRRRAIFWGVVLAITVAIVDTLSWCVPFSWNPKQTWTAPDAYAPLKIPAEFYQATIVWVIYLTLPFMLSQLVYVSLMTLTFVMKDCMKHINEQLDQEGKLIEKLCTEDLFKANEHEECSQLTTRRLEMERLLSLHTELLDVCNSVNRMFTLIFFFTYTLDLGVALGDIATMISTPHMPTLMWVFTAIRCCVFFGYCSVLQIPEINFNIQATDLVDHLCEYMGQALPIVQTIQGSRLHVVLQIFFTKCKEQAAVINGGHVFYATRKLFIATYTVGFSFAVLAHEFFGEMKTPANIGPDSAGSATAGGNATANGTAEAATHGKE